MAAAPGVGVLPDELRREALACPSTPERLVFAMGDTDLAPRALTLAQGHVLVTGPPRSGKTTTLATIAQAASAARLPLFHVHVRPTPLGHAPFWGKVARGAERRRGAARARRSQALPKLGKRVVVVVDDLGELADTEADTALVELLRLGREHPVTIIAAVDNTVARRQYSGAIPEMRKDGVAVLLQPGPRHRRRPRRRRPARDARVARCPRAAATSPSAAPPSSSRSPSPTRSEPRCRRIGVFRAGGPRSKALGCTKHSDGEGQVAAEDVSRPLSPCRSGSRTLRGWGSAPHFDDRAGSVP